MALKTRITLVILATVLCTFTGCEALRCYQCNSDADPYDQDLCGANTYVDTYKYPPTECRPSDTLCIKITTITQRASEVESPYRTTSASHGWKEDGGKLRQVVRKCGSTVESGVTGVCLWGVSKTGAYYQECSCSSDSCNGSTSLFATSTIFVTAFGVVYSLLLWT